MKIDEVFQKISRWPKEGKILLLVMALIGTLFILSAVFAPCAKAAELNFSWVAPTTNADGTPLTDLAGYRLYRGDASGNYSSSVDVGNVLQFTWDLGDVEGQTLFFNVTAYDTSGNVSDYNGEVSHPFPANPPAPPGSLRIAP